MAPRAQGLHCTFAPSTLSSRLVVQVDVQVGEATLWWEWMLGREGPPSAKTRQMDKSHQGTGVHRKSGEQVHTRAKEDTGR